MTRNIDVAVIGAGSAGITAVTALVKAGRNAVLINSGPEGTTCARIGCMPSKALIEAANAYHMRDRMGTLGLNGTEGLSVDGPAVMARVRAVRDMLVGGLVKRYHGLLGADRFIEGHARIVAPDCIEVNGERIETGAIVIATGSTPVVPPPFRALGDALLTTDTLFEQTDLPKSLAVVGLGAIGCEIGQAMARLGVEVHGFDAAPVVAGVRDPALAETVLGLFRREMSVTTGAQVTPHLEPDGRVRIEAGDRSCTVDRVLASIGRRPNLVDLGLETLGVALDSRGMPPFDPETLRIGDLPIYIAGDANGDRALLHEATEEGRIVAENILSDAPRPFRRKVPLAIAFTGPQIASVGAQLPDLDPETTAIGSASAARNGRAKIKGDTDGMIRIYADKDSGRLLGASLAIVYAEHMAHWLALAIAQDMTLEDCLAVPFYHPVVEETLKDALQHCLSQTGRRLPHTPGLVPA